MVERAWFGETSIVDPGICRCDLATLARPANSDLARAGTTSSRERRRFADTRPLHQKIRREKIRDRRCRNERPDPAGVVPQLPRNCSGGGEDSALTSILSALHPVAI